MPQLLHYLLKDRPTKRKKTVMEDANIDLVKDALQQTEDIIRHAPPEHVSPMLVDARNAKLQQVRDELLETNEEIDWGVVAVYTCTNSCGDISDEGPTDQRYREEFAWLQASLD